MMMSILAIAGSIVALPIKAQIAVVRPDVAAPGMSIVLEVLAKNSLPGYFGPDGFAPKGISCSMLDPADSTRVQFGPLCISWNGRLLQIPVYLIGNDPGPAPIVIRGQNAYDTIAFSIVLAQQLSTLTGNVVLGQGANGNVSPHNTIVVDKLIANNATITISPLNAGLEPVTILSGGPVVLNNSTISVRANGISGGFGGGGGGHGFEGEGGAGFTGGGNSAVRPPSGNRGSDPDSMPSITNGGPSLTGVAGGGSEPDKDQGGGGGTGCPYGTSGLAGVENASSPPGGFGGGSGGGETISVAYGGGGGGFGTDGSPGGQPGAGVNNGLHNGGRFLIPLQGGSGGGAGNSEGLPGAGNGGGGGGGIALIGFDSMSFVGSSIIAEGDSGTSGGPNTAGGGGGSGGGILVATNVQLSASNFGIRIGGGSAGQGGPAQFAGGGGGFGRLRLDGGEVPVNIPLTSIGSSIISIQKPATLIAGNWIRLSGFATDLANETDSIRIYYRSNRTSWTRVDTLRDRTTGQWSKWIPRTFDSVLYVATCIKVNTPSSAFANLEPDWAMSHAGLMLLRESPAPHLTSADTLSFGSVRVGQCKTLRLLLKNDGSAPLRVDSIKIDGKQYSVSPSTGFTLAPHRTDTLLVTFCPDSGKAIAGRLQFFTNDQFANPKRIVLTGVGTLKNDSLVVTPSTVRFSRVRVGECDSISVLLRSAGKDTVYLLAPQWNQPPFSLSLSPSDTSLAPGDSVHAVVHFCPRDSGDSSTSFVIDAHGDSISAFGHGIIRTLASLNDTLLDTLCLGHDLVFSLPIRNLGNDTVSILSVSISDPNITLEAPQLPILLKAHETRNVAFSLRAPSLISQTNTIRFASSDTIVTSIVRYTVSGSVLSLDTDLNFGALCAGLSDTVSFRFRNDGRDVVNFSIDTTGFGPTFTAVDTIHGSIGSAIARAARFVFSPLGSGDFSNRVTLHATTGNCDSTYSFLLRGTGSTGELTASDLTFDTTVIGACRDDSLLVQNPCGPAQTLARLTLAPPFQYLDSGLQSASIPPGGSVMLHFRFCPDSSGLRSQTIVLGTLHPTIRGVGKDTTRPWAAFRISNAPDIRSGETGTTATMLDSSTVRGVHSITVNMIFDPTVVWPERAQPAPGRLTAEGVYSYDTTIDFSAGSQFLDVITWRGLIGPRESTIVSLTVTPDTLFETRVRPGKITVIDCENLSGHVSISGPYIIRSVKPSIITNSGSVNVEFGNSGPATGEVLDMTGRHITTVFDRDFERGSYDIPLNVQGIASGRYMFVVRSMGWQGMTPFMLER